MNLSNWMVLVRGRSRVREVALEIASNCEQATWERTCERVLSLGHAEGRGYVRARAAGLIDVELKKLVEAVPGTHRELVEQLTHLASEEIIRRVLERARRVQHDRAITRRAA